MKVNVLGTKYKITFKDYDKDELFESEGIYGYVNVYNKKIVCCNMNTYPNWEKSSKETCEIAQKKVIRHEIVHAFFSESGLMGSSNNNMAWAENEEMVDWIAIQGIKIYTAWEQSNAI